MGRDAYPTAAVGGGGGGSSSGGNDSEAQEGSVLTAVGSADAASAADATGASAGARASESSSAAPAEGKAGAEEEGGRTAAASDAASDAVAGGLYAGNGCLKFIDDELRTPAVKDLEALDGEFLAVKQEYEAERHAIRQKFEAQCCELLARRRSLLTASEPAFSGTAVSSTASATPALPGFWRMVMQNSAEFEEIIERHDEPVLDYLQDVQTCWLDESALDKGFKLRFLFSPNPYFTNDVLEKTYHTERKNHYTDRVECVKIDATPIHWQLGKNVTVDVVSKKPKGGIRRRTAKPKKEEVPRASFFRVYFRSLGPDEELPEEELEGEEEEGVDLMECLIMDDYEQGMFLKEHIIPHAVRWFTGEACEEEDEGSTATEGGGEEDADSQEGEDDEEEDEEEDEEDEEDSPRGARAIPRGGAGRASPKKMSKFR